jgi:hypothetical protein
MWFQSASTERSAAFRNKALSLAKRFDRIEVRRIRRQIKQLCACGFDRFMYPGRLMGGEIVQHDDVTWREGRGQDLFDIGEEGVAVHRAVDDAGCGKSCGAQARDKGGGFPVTVRDFADQPFAAWSPAVQPRHFR